MKVNEPDSLVCWLERMMVRVSPLATADSVEFGTSQAAVNATATASCAAAPPRPMQLLTLKPANNPSFPNTSPPAAKPGGPVPIHVLRLRFCRPLPPTLRDLPSACPWRSLFAL